MWSPARLALVIELREWALQNLDLCLIFKQTVNGSVAIFKKDVDDCFTDDSLLEMLHKRLDVKQPRI